jgi:hypothetical protein
MGCPSTRASPENGFVSQYGAAASALHNPLVLRLDVGAGLDVGRLEPRSDEFCPSGAVWGRGAGSGTDSGGARSWRIWWRAWGVSAHPW